MKEQKLRRKVRSLIKEELSRDRKQDVLADLEREVENVVSSVLIEHDVHKQGLSDQQEATLYRRVSGVVDRVLDQFMTKRKPSNIQGVEDYEKYTDLI